MDTSVINCNQNEKKNQHYVALPFCDFTELSKSQHSLDKFAPKIKSEDIPISS